MAKTMESEKVITLPKLAIEPSTIKMQNTKGSKKAEKHEQVIVGKGASNGFIFLPFAPFVFFVDSSAFVLVLFVVILV